MTDEVATSPIVPDHLRARLLKVLEPYALRCISPDLGKDLARRCTEVLETYQAEQGPAYRLPPYRVVIEVDGIRVIWLAPPSFFIAPPMEDP